MKGLLKKDFLLLRSVALPMVAILVMLFVSALVEYIDIVYSFILWAMVMVTAIFNQDRFYRMEEFIASIPDGKAKAVKARYLTSIILLVILTLLALSLLGINSLIHCGFSFKIVPIIVLVTIAFSILGLSLFFPLTYRFGIMKTSLLSGFWAIGGMLAIFFQIEKSINTLIVNYSMNKIYLGCGLLLFATLCIFYVSYIISIKAYLKREK